MMRRCTDADVPAIYSIINDAAVAYKGVIPEDRWHEPYMPLDELKTEILRGVNFWGYEENYLLTGVMGIQDVKDVTLIRHAYVKQGKQKRGIGTKLLGHLIKLTDRPLLVGTWKAAVWAVEFYRKNGFTPVTEKEKNILLKKYWTIPERQVETSVVLADRTWFSEYHEIFLKKRA
jgi:GNAT superfamily N-acetyltransferase